MSDEVPNEEGEFEISAYPNPFVEGIKLDMFIEESAVIDIRIFNALGKEVYTRQLSVDEGYQTSRIELSELSSGVYIMKVNNLDINIDQTIKIVKQ